MVEPANDRAAERLNQVRSAVFAQLASDRQSPLAAGTVPHQPVAAQPDGAVRPRADRRDPGRGDRGDGKASGQGVARHAWAGQPPQGRTDRPAGLERPDRQRRRLRPECLRGRGRTGGPRPSSGHDAASPQVSSDGPRPDVGRMFRPGRLREEPAPAGRAPAIGRSRRPGPSTPAGRRSRPSAVRIATHPSWGMSRGSTATCSSTTWARRWATSVRMALIVPMTTAMIRRILRSARDVAPNGRRASRQRGRARGATRQEWRTPPLWGFRDSGPYLHDGRAQTLEEAVAMHGGQGAFAAQAVLPALAEGASASRGLPQVAGCPARRSAARPPRRLSRIRTRGGSTHAT